mmetsp:Transcript_40166/g.97009  ORF Transcript_40166/g.97009 Transcript_40166/m.97009 type:complete len:592 (-) Transcript_40166:248-2023(-)
MNLFTRRPSAARVENNDYDYDYGYDYDYNNNGQKKYDDDMVGRRSRHHRNHDSNNNMMSSAATSVASLSQWDTNMTIAAASSSSGHCDYYFTDNNSSNDGEGDEHDDWSTYRLGGPQREPVGITGGGMVSKQGQEIKQNYDYDYTGSPYTGLDPVSSTATRLNNQHQLRKQQQGSPGGVLRKLNCTASRRDVREQQELGNVEIQALPPTKKSEKQAVVNNWQKKQSSWGRLMPKKEPKIISDITRPVLITVKDGEYSPTVSGASGGGSEQNDTEMKSKNKKHHRNNKKSTEEKFVVGELPRNHPSRVPSSPFRNFGRSMRNWNQKKSNNALYNGSSEKETPSSPLKISQMPHSGALDSTHTTNGGSDATMCHTGLEQHNETKDLLLSSVTSCSPLPNATANCNSMMENVQKTMTAQEKARKERWRRGIELERRMWEEKAKASQSLSLSRRSAGSSARDGRKSLNNSNPALDSDSDTQTADGSHTTGTVTGRTRTNHSRSSSAEDSTDTTDTDDSDDYDDRPPRVLLSSSTTRKKKRTTSSNTSDKSEQPLFGDVAEDLGIFAKLILADGSACVGTAAAITSETVGCRAASQ